MKAVRTVETIRDVAARMIGTVGSGLLVNRARTPGEAEAVLSSSSLEPLGWVPEDDAVRRFDADGESFLDLPDCPASLAIVEALDRAGFLERT
jgi:MinD superfamily P-loop ATPase